ncbi:MAG: hypothetical protein LBN26_05390 [Christensenellaceae bacterium]|jgi:hypothetical protein|nr:hypothetical protein [Christensenellaceae bacterium]
MGEKRKCRKRPARPVIPPREGAAPIPSDVQGSYTGMGENGERPVQDADDL